MPHVDFACGRATPVQRAADSLHQVFTGLFPHEWRSPSLKPPTILSRTADNENLMPNESNCRRFLQLSRAFGKRAAERWNDTEDMNFLTAKIGKYLNSEVAAVDGRPRLSGVLDSI